MMRNASHGRRVRAVFLGVLIALLVLAVVSIGASFMFSINSGIDDAYALWGAAEMVIDYMKTHEGSWPRDWNDLRPQFNANNGRVGGWTFSRFEDRIAIDFNADPNQLCQESVESPRATFRVIWATHDSGVRIGDDPNQKLCDYFRNEDERGNFRAGPDVGKRKDSPK
jgi:hypothetical protein